MKKRFLIAGLALATSITFAQKKEIKKAEKAISSHEYNEALSYLNEAESSLGSVDNTVQAQFYAARGAATLGVGKMDSKKILIAAQAYEKAISLDPKIKDQIPDQLNALRSALIDAAVIDQNAKNYPQAVEKLYASYNVSKNPIDLYFAAGNAVNGNDYDSALKYYQILLDSGFTGEGEEFVATNKENGEVIAFDNQNMRDIGVKSGQFIKPEIRKSDSKKGEILRNMTLIYMEAGNNEKASQLMKAARAENPDDMSLMRSDAEMSYKMGDVARYNELMNKIAESDPTNPEIFFNLGVASTQVGDNVKAAEYYEKALKLKPEHEGALINIAVLKLAGEDKIIEEMNALGNSASDNKKYDELKKRRQEIYVVTLPYLQQAYKINPNNSEVVRTLMNIYGQMGDDAKYKELKAKMEEFKVEE